MALRDGRWEIELKLPDGRLLRTSTDDMTLQQVDVVERASGWAWGAWDPPRSARTATALFAVLLMVDGESEDKALQLARELPASALRGAFTFVQPDEDRPADQVVTDPPS